MGSVELVDLLGLVSGHDLSCRGIAYWTVQLFNVHFENLKNCTVGPGLVGFFWREEFTGPAGNLLLFFDERTRQKNVAPRVSFTFTPFLYGSLYFYT